MTRPDVFTGFLPILDMTIPIGDLLEEAREQVPRLMRQTRCELVGWPRLRVARGSEVPGAGAYGWVITVNALARRMDKAAS